MLVRELIDRLESSGTVDHEIIEALRQQLEESGARVTPEAVAKLLVDNGHLTRFQATKLIGELRGGDDDDLENRAGESDELDLGLADDDASGEVVVEDGEQVAIIVDDDDDDVAEAAIIEDDVMVAEAVAVDADVVDAEPVEAEVMTAEAVDDDAPMAEMAPHPVVPAGERSGGKKQQANQWDSVWIYGVAGIIVLLLGVGGGLVFYLNRMSAEDYIKKANEAWSNANYPAAREVYTKFLEAYPGDKNISTARVRVGYASIVIAQDTLGDANAGVQKAREVLPTIETEEAFESHRQDIASTLVDIGSNLAKEADKQSLADDKAVTLKQLDSWFELLENPMYFSSESRKNLGPRITGIEETRARVVRDIARDRDLVQVTAEMKKAIAEKETKDAFDMRTELIRKYRQLSDHPELTSLVLEASSIQRELVKSAEQVPQVSTEPLADSAYQSLLLANRTGRSVPELVGRVVYLRARGSVLAVAADSGQILWRRFVGYNIDNPPVPLGDALDDGVLLSDGRQGELQRIANNKVVWRAAINERFSIPVVDGSTIFTTTESGRVLALDSQTGDSRWVKQIPQALQVAPGKQPRGNFMYVPAEHSNLYALSADNGSCVQSYYVGHDLGTIRVPPVELLGHLFLFENAGTDYCLVHILKVDEQAGTVEVAQSEIRLTGNVMTSPVVQGRRLIVLTDLGQVSVLDIEPSAERNKVSIVAEQVPTYDRPTPTEMAVGRSEIWVTGSQIARYQLQINTGKVVRDWVKHKADTFIAQPILIEDTLIHARQMRGTQGVRITAADPRDGTVLWQNDVGVPVALLSADPESRAVFAVTSQAALYQLGAENLAADSTLQPIENPGGDGVALRFGNPLDAGNRRRLLLNQETAKELLVLDPSRSREKLRMVQLMVPEGSVTSAESILMAGGLLLPMDNGRIMLLNWESGMSLGSPFQPPTRPGQRVKWTTPIPNPSDPEQLLICDDSPTLFRLRVGEQIRELSKTKMGERLLGPAAAGNTNWIAAAGGAAGDLLVTYNVNSLEETARKMLGNRIIYGPVSVGDAASGAAVILQTSDGKLHRIEENAEIKWSLDVPSGQPAAVPQMVNGKMYVTGQDGWILVVDPASGNVEGRVDVGQPLAGNPLVAGSQMLVPGSEGIVFVVSKP